MTRGLSDFYAGRSPPVRSTIRIVALTSCAMLSGLSVAQAQSQTPMQFWHQEWSRQRSAYADQGQGYSSYQSQGYQQRGWFGGSNYDSYDPEPDPARERASRGPMPQVHVDNPTFYDYKPDTLKTVALATNCKPQISPAAQAAQATLKPQKVSETTGAAPSETPAPTSRMSNLHMATQRRNTAASAKRLRRRAGTTRCCARAARPAWSTT